MLQDFELALTFNSGNIAPMVSRARIKAMGSEDTGTAWNYAMDPESKASDLIKFDEYGAMLNDVLAYRAALPDPAGYVEDYDPTVPLGVQNLYRLLSLADEPRVTYTQRGGTKANRVILVMNSPVFPQMSIYGHITPGGLSWEEGAEHPNSFDITLTLTVTDTWPKLGLAGLGSLLSGYRNAVDNNYNTRDGIYAVEQNGKVTSGKISVSPTSGANASKLAGNAEEEETLASSMTDISAAAEQIAKENGSTGFDYTNESALAIAKMSPKQLANMEVADAMAARAKLDDIAASWSEESKAKINSQSQEQLATYASKMLANASADKKAQVQAIVADPTYSNIQKVVTINGAAAVAAKSRTRGAVASRIPGASRKGSRSA
jgi:nucleotide-binding universal stress UspA family protein